MNEPEEWRAMEKKAQKMSADIAEDMLRRPRWRRILRPLHRLMKWVERMIDKELREEGWR